MYTNKIKGERVVLVEKKPKKMQPAWNLCSYKMISVKVQLMQLISN